MQSANFDGSCEGTASGGSRPNTLVGDNAYELLRVAASVSEGSPFEDPLFKQVTDQRGNVLPAPIVTNIWGELV